MRDLSRPTDWHALQLFLEIPSVNQYTVLRSTALSCYLEPKYNKPNSPQRSTVVVPTTVPVNLTLSLFSSAFLFDQIKKENSNKLRFNFIYSFYVILTLITHVGKI